LITQVHVNTADISLLHGLNDHVKDLLECTSRGKLLLERKAQLTIPFVYLDRNRTADSPVKPGN
jgi:hypothetical protein